MAHLDRHGIRIFPDVRQVRTQDEHSTLLLQIEKGHYDLLVMGGYSHPMWMEFIFGGATHSALIASKMPVLVSH